MQTGVLADIKHKVNENRDLKTDQMELEKHQPNNKQGRFHLTS